MRVDGDERDVTRVAGTLGNEALNAAGMPMGGRKVSFVLRLVGKLGGDPGLVAQVVQGEHDLRGRRAVHAQTWSGHVFSLR